MKNFFLLALAGIATSTIISCSSFGPKPHVVYHRPDLKNQPEKVIVMPVTNFSGKETAGTKDVEMSINTGWSNQYGASNVIPAGPAIKKMGSTQYIEILKTMDNISMVEQLAKNKKFKSFINEVTGKFGNYHLGFALLEGDQKTYDAKNPVVLHLGLFDTKNLTWKWITKIQDKKGPIGDWRAAYPTMISNSFDKGKELDTAERSLASKN